MNKIQRKQQKLSETLQKQKEQYEKLKELSGEQEGKEKP